jgi:hypothetical protein
VPLPYLDGAHEPSGPAAKDDDIELVVHSCPESAGVENMSTREIAKIAIIAIIAVI